MKILIMAMLALSPLAHAELEPHSPDNTQNWDEALEEINDDSAARKASDDPKDDTDEGSDALGKIFGALDQLTIKFSLGDTIDLLDGLGFRLEHSEEIEPAFYGNYFSRMDGYEVGLRSRLLEIAGIDTDFRLGIEPNLEVRMYQFFDDKNSALNPKNIYLPSRIPFTAEKALERLKPGDLVAFDGDLNVYLGYTHFLEKIADWINLRFDAGRTFRGRLRFYVFRADNNFIRLRVSAIRNSPKEIGARLRLFDLFDLGWSRLTELVEEALSLDELFRAHLRKVKQDLWLADFTLNMADPRVRSAYDHIFDRERRVRTMSKAANPFRSVKELEGLLWDALKPMTELAVGEQNKSNPVATVNFMGTNFSNGGYFDIEAGVSGVWRSEMVRVKQDNRLRQRLYDADGKAFDRYYFFPSWLRRNKKSAMGTLNRERKSQAANIIYRTDENFEIIGFESIGFYREETDKKYDNSEHQEIISHFKRLLPEDSYQRFVNYLKANNWGSFSGYRQNVRINARYFITEEGLKMAEGARADEVAGHIVAALHKADQMKNEYALGGVITGSRIPICPLRKLRKMGVKTYKYAGRGVMKESRRGEYLGVYTQKYCDDIERLAEKLSQALDPEVDPALRNKIFTQFGSSSMFRLIGPGLLFDILGGRELGEEVTYFEFVINASGQKTPVRFSAGKIDNRPLYEIILQMEQIFREDQPDMRLPGREESLVRRIFD